MTRHEAKTIAYRAMYGVPVVEIGDMECVVDPKSGTIYAGPGWWAKLKEGVPVWNEMETTNADVA